MVFRVKGLADTTDIVTNTGKDNYFYSLQCLFNKKRDDFMIINGIHEGTAGPGDILEVVGRFPREMLEARILEFWKSKLNGNVGDEQRKAIHNQLSSEPRRINLD